VLDADTRIVDINQAARVMLERISGESHGSLNGKRLDQAVKGLDSWIAAHSSLEEREIELHFGTEAEPFYIAVKIIPVIYGTQTYAGSMSVMTDMTEIRRNELELRWRAVTDGLTGIYNRYGFIEKTEHAIRASLEENLPLCLLVVDIDHFKRINDRYGHLAGDKAIQAFVGAVERIREESWIFGRIGGEEFAITLSNVGEVEALAIAEYIRDEVQQTVVQSSRDNIRFTVSIGVACQTVETNTFERLYSLADQSLYKVKQGGRNGVHMENLG
jgi:diguanylate cyclase (GGDEF)-like protein